MKSAENLWALEEGMGRCALPCCWRGISGRTPERSVFEQFSSPVPRGHWDQHQCWLGRAELRPWNTACVTMFWSQPLTLFIAVSSGSVNSIRGFTGLHVHQIHKAPHGSTTKTSQKSMKSFPEGFVQDLSSKALFASMQHQYRQSAAWWQPLALKVFTKWHQETHLQKVNYGCSHFITNTQPI